MKKHVGLNPAWFEPGPDGESPFVRKYNASPGTAGEAVAAAFRALLAGEEQPQVLVDLSTTPDTTRAVMADANGNVLQEVEVTHDGTSVIGVTTEPRALRVGDVVRLEPWDYSYSPEVLRENWAGEQARIIEAPEGHDWNRDGHIHVELLVHKGCSHATWPVSALTLIRRAGAPLAVDDVPSETDWQKLEAERDELKARLAAAEKHFDAWVNSGLWCWNVGGFSASLCWADLCDSLNYNKAGAPDRRAREHVSVDADAKDAEIAELRESLERTKLALNTTREQRDQFWSQRDAARAEVERWKSIAEAHEQNYKSMLRRVDEVVAERDALRARIDAGVPVYSAAGELWSTKKKWSQFTKILIDPRPIDRDHIADPGKMVDDRTGPADRREIGCDASYEARIAVGRDHTREYQTEDIDCDGTINCARSNNRRRTAGTIADRGKA